jgi:hypothetical protein
VISGEAGGEPVEAFGYRFIREMGHRLGTGVDLDPRDRARVADDVGEGRAVGSLLEQCFLIEDDAGDILAHRIVRAQQHLAIVAARVLGGLQADAVEALLDRCGRLVCSEQAPAIGDHGNRNVFQSFAHILLLHTAPITSGTANETNLELRRESVVRTSGTKAR